MKQATHVLLQPCPCLSTLILTAPLPSVTISFPTPLGEWWYSKRKARPASWAPEDYRTDQRPHIYQEVQSPTWAISPAGPEVIRSPELNLPDTLFSNTGHSSQNFRNQAGKHPSNKTKLRNWYLDLWSLKSRSLNVSVRTQLTAAWAVTTRAQRSHSNKPWYSNTGKAQKNDLKTKFLKMIEILKE